LVDTVQVVIFPLLSPGVDTNFLAQQVSEQELQLLDSSTVDGRFIVPLPYNWTQITDTI